MSDSTDDVGVAELVASLSYAADLGLGQPLRHCMRKTVIALRMADRLGVDDAEREAAVVAAKAAYAKAKLEGVDLERGPCIAEELLPGWVADIAHDPRRDADDDPENQCTRYRDGLAGHFVELDPDGNLIRAE